MDTDDQKGGPAVPPRRARWADVRDVLLFVLGAAGFMHELLAGGGVERPYLLTLSGVMMGLGKALEVTQHVFAKRTANGGDQ